MALAMSQATLDRFGLECAALTPLRRLTYHVSGMAGATSRPVWGRWVDYTQYEKARNPLLLHRKLLRVARPEFDDLTPVLGAVLRGVEGETWEIKETDGGTDHAFWYLQCIQVS